MVCGLLPTEIRIVIIQSVQNLAKCLVEPRVRLIQTIGLGVMRHRVVTHLLLVVLLNVALSLHMFGTGRVNGHLVDSHLLSVVVHVVAGHTSILR